MMDDYNLKLILKSELKTKIPSYLFKELVEEIQIADESLGKTELIDLIFEKYSLQEITNLILEKYEDERHFSKRERFINRINGLNIDERKEIERKEKEKNKKKPVYSPVSLTWDTECDYNSEYLENLCEYLGYKD